MPFIRRKNERLFTLSEHFKVGCTFQVEKFRNDGAVTYRGPEFSNLVLNVGLDQMASSGFGIAGGNCYYINVGEGSSTPAQTQTGLDNFLAATNNDISSSYGYQASTPYHKWGQATFEFAIGSCTGNLTELGLSGSSNAEYFNRQLFRDDAGDPTTITVKSDEGLRITAKGFFYPDIEPGDTVAGSFLLNGTDTIDTIREMTADTYWLSRTEYGKMIAIRDPNGRMPFITDSNTAFKAGTGPDSNSEIAYTNGNYYRDNSYTWAAGTFIGDVNTICFCIGVDWSQAWEFSAFRLTPAITLADTDELTLTLRRSWGRYAA